MLKTTAALLLLGFSQVASAEVIYQYTGPALDVFGNWAQAFGATPTEITATVETANPFPMDPLFQGGTIGSVNAGNLPGIDFASISDGVRTLTPDTVFLAGYGTTVRSWMIGAGFYPQQHSSDCRAIATSSTDFGCFGQGDFDIAATFDANNNPVFYDADSGRATGTWTATVTPEINTGGMALVSVSLLIVGCLRKRH